MPDYELKDKVVIVTGSSSGLGRGIAEAFAIEGSCLTLTGRNKETLEETAQTCVKLGLPATKILKLVVDHSKDEDNTKTIRSTIDTFGKLDVLVNNAGVGLNSTIQDTIMADYDRVMTINARSLFYLTKVAFPHLKKTKGNIVNVSSVAAIRSFPSISAYGMSKALVDQLTKTSCLEFAKDGVRVNAINPGYIHTNIITRMNVFSSEQYQKFLEAQARVHPLGRNGQVKEISDLVTFLSSARASFITGETIAVDGGWSNLCPAVFDEP